MKSLATTLFVLLFAAASSVMAQQNTYTLMEKSTLKIDGTSTIHDWTVDAQEINLNLDFNAAALEGESKSNPVSALTLTVPVKELESGKGGMNKKIYGALKEDDHPNIMFKLSSAELSGGDAQPGFTLNVSGQLTIAGFSRDITFPVEGTLQDDGSYKFTGSYELNMKDYEVDPPSAVFGTIRSGEMVTVSFEFFVNQR